MAAPRENDPADMLDLVEKLFDGRASADEAHRIEAELERSADRRRDFVLYSLLNAQLRMTDEALGAAFRTMERGRLSPANDRAAGHPVSIANVGMARNGSPVSGRVKNVLPGSARSGLRFYGAVTAAVLVAIVAAAWSIGSRRSMPGRLPAIADTVPSEIRFDDDFELPRESVAVLTQHSGAAMQPQMGQTLSATTLKLDRGTAELDAIGGADIRLDGPVLYGLNSDRSGILFNGSVQARLTKPDASYSVQTSNLKVVDLGTEFRVSLVDADHIAVEVLDGEVQIESQRRLPLYFWNFDGDEAGFADAVARQAVEIGSAARLTSGILGRHAIAFDNTPNNYVRVLGGTGEKVGTGRFACSSGITIEAVIVSRWTGLYHDYDEIFRKNDGVYRVLLSFQNDNQHYDVPDVPPGPCLSFGLHLGGHGYSELDMPLDGRDGRPTVADLTDGNPHHVVALYDSFSGRKALYVDGQLCFEHRFPLGTLILNGGPEPAFIGNCSNRREPFSGLIDDVAYYDFAITDDEIARHSARVSRGDNYFGDDLPHLGEAQWQTVTRLEKGQRAVFNRHLGERVEKAGPLSEK